ncbi:MAG: T9SS type A sorting domain-containing protein [Bacteroidia bacterium]|nr:T9SS type A sorting domain-containing protein [Bacteroidia bacterium]
MRLISLYLSLIVSTLSFSQVPVSGKFVGKIVPKIIGSGDTTRLPFVFRGEISGLSSKTKYKYYVKAINYADFKNSSTTGAGYPILIDTTKNWRYTTNPGFTGSQVNDTFTTDASGKFQHWFSFFYYVDSRFTAGKYIYPMIILQKVGESTIEKYYLNDSVQVVKFDKTNDGTSATGIWGKSGADPKNIVVFYDKVNGSSRPVTVTYVENEVITGYRLCRYYTQNVEGKTRTWGTLLPNKLDSGIRRVELYYYKTNKLLWSKTSKNGTWAKSAKSTVNPTGGVNSPIFFDDYELQLSEPVFEFTLKNLSISEGTPKTNVIVTRKYANEMESKVTLNINDISAKNGSGLDYSSITSKLISYNNGPSASDTTVISINNDVICEGNESFVCMLQSPSNCVIGANATQDITITDNDRVSIYFNPKTISALEGNTTVVAKVRLNLQIENPVSFRIFTKYVGKTTSIPNELTYFNNNNDTLVTVNSTTTPYIDIPININLKDEIIQDKADTLKLVIRKNTGYSSIYADSILTLSIKDNDSNATVQFETQKLSVLENEINPRFLIKLTNYNNNISDFNLKFEPTLSTAILGTDFYFSPTSQDLSLTSGVTEKYIYYQPINDSKREVTKTIVFTLKKIKNCKIGTSDTLRIKLIDNDIPLYPINKINKVNITSGIPDSINVYCCISGLVLETNKRTIGYTFTVNDRTGGCQIFSAGKTLNYIPKEGDSIILQGTLTNLNGMLQMINMDTIFHISSGNKIPDPMLNFTVNESTQSKLIKIETVRIVNPVEWPTSKLPANSGKTVYCKTVVGNFYLYIDSETDIDSTAFPAGFYNITGIGFQSDGSNPYTSGYYLAPRKLSDFEPLNSPIIKFKDTIQYVIEGTVAKDSIKIVCEKNDRDFTTKIKLKGGTATMAIDYTMFNTEIMLFTKQKPSNSLSFVIADDTEIENDETIIFVLREVAWGVILDKDSIYTVIIKDNEVNKTHQIKGDGFKIYPIPADKFVKIESKKEISEIELYNFLGEKMLLRISENKIYTENLSSGIYYLNFICDKKTYKSKIIVNR